MVVTSASSSATREKPVSDRDAIELKVDKVSQLFDTLDPFPFHERDLDRDAEDFIVSWARELPANKAIHIVVHLPAGEADSEHAREIDKALATFFTYRSGAVSRDLKEMFRVGRLSLAIGIVVLAACLFAGRSLTSFFPRSEIAGFADEGLVILGWVANWRPLEIFLYDWWPLVRRRNLYGRLASAEVRLSPR